VASLHWDEKELAFVGEVGDDGWDHSSRRSGRGQAFAGWLVGCCVSVRR
jgi:hypothetical protein